MIQIRAFFTQSLAALRPTRENIEDGSVPFLLAAGFIYMAVLVFNGQWLVLLPLLPAWGALLAIAAYEPARQRLIGGRFTLPHVLHVIFYWVLASVWAVLLRQLLMTPAAGKESQFFYVALLAFVGITWAAARSALIWIYPRANEVFSVSIPSWEQVLLIINESIAIGLMAYLWATVLVRVFQPFVFTTRLNLTYGLGLGGAALLYYVLLQFMWLQHWNARLSENRTWILLARIFSPFVLFVISVLIASRFTERTDPRTASLLDNADIDLAVLALVPVIWLLVLVIIFLVYTGDRGIRQRFLPDALVERLPQRIQNRLLATSDVDLLLVIGMLTTFIPVYLLFLGEGGGIVGQARQVILQRGNALLETSEQALAILFVMPFYLFIILLLLLYAVVISRPRLSAKQRDTIMDQLPIGFMITMIITLYLFAVPFTQVFTEGRLPTLSRDLGRILAFYVLIPLLLLYVHFFLLVRFPYGRGQRLWREKEAVVLEQDLRKIDRRIGNLNQELSRIDNKWQLTRGDDNAALRGRMDTLHRYIHLNGERDNLNMQRLQIISARQNLAEISETPLSVAVARLPLRIISLALPLLLFFQLYQWAVLNEGLREVVNNPNITVADFIRILLDNIEF